MRVLKYVISSVEENKMALLWVLPFRINQHFLVAGAAGGEWCPFPLSSQKCRWTVYYRILIYDDDLLRRN